MYLFVPEVSLFWLRWNLIINIEVPFVSSHSMRLCLKVVNRFTIIIINNIFCVTFFLCVYVYFTPVAFHVRSRKKVDRTQLISVVAPPYPAPTPFPFTRSNYTVRFWWVLSASNFSQWARATSCVFGFLIERVLLILKRMNYFNISTLFYPGLH